MILFLRLMYSCILLIQRGFGMLLPIWPNTVRQVAGSLFLMLLCKVDTMCPHGTRRMIRCDL